MKFLRSIWIFVVGFLSLGPITAPLPWLGSSGGLWKIVAYMNGGRLFMWHSLLLLGYAGLVYLGLVSLDKIKTPAAISIASVFGITLPVALTLFTCSPEWIDRSSSATSPKFHLTNLWQPRGVSFAKWTSPISMCTDLSSYINETSVYRSSIPVIGPSSLEATFLNPFSKQIMASLGNDTKTSLHTVYFPIPRNGSTEEKPGLIIFVHGGGWWNGDINNPPGPCHAEFALQNGWAYGFMEYRLGRSGWSGDVQLHDVREGMQHLLKKHGKDLNLNKVVLIGSSAGAALGLTASYQLNNERASVNNPVIAGILAVAPSTSVNIGTSQHSVPKWSGAWDEAGATKRYCEGVKNCNKRLSALEHVSKYSPPTVLLHGPHDEWYTPRHSRELVKKLIKYGIPHVHIEPPLMPHCLDIVPNSIPTQMAFSALQRLMESL